MSCEKATARENSFPSTSMLLTKTQLSNTGEQILEVDIDNVKEILEDSKYKDCYVAIYTIAGPMRTGKSFLLSLLWSFLQNNRNENNYQQWLNSKEKATKIFNWRRGVKPCTKGIHILKEPIFVDLEEKKIALFLADTQGIFDNYLSERDQAFLVTFSFLLSSFLIFNVQNRIETTHLESIYKHSADLRGSDNRSVMEKETLMFVVRDWENVESEESESDCDEVKKEQDGDQLENQGSEESGNDFDEVKSEQDDDQSENVGRKKNKDDCDGSVNGQNDDQSRNDVSEENKDDCVKPASWQNNDYSRNDKDGKSINADQVFPYGTKGGKKYLQSLLQNKSSDEIIMKQKMMQEYLNFAFGDKISCCLLPHPGDAVKRKTCNMSDLDEEFRKESLKFFLQITSKNQNGLELKQIQSKMCKCGELCDAIKDYVALLGYSLNVTDAQSFFEADFRVNMSNHLKFFVERFLNKIIKHSYVENNLKEKLNSSEFEIEKEFEKATQNLGPQELLKPWKKEFQNALYQITEILKICYMHVEGAYKKAVLKYNDWLKKHRINQFKNMENYQAQTKRNKILKKLKEKYIPQEVRKKKDFEQIFSQCEKCFNIHTNKLTANVDDDIQSFLEIMQSKSITVKSLTVDLEALVVAFPAERSEVNLKDHSLNLYEKGEMNVELSFGTLTFKLNTREKL